jgi:hypothetical protein
MIELINGDRYFGEVIRVDKTTVEFASEIQGTISIPREKVALISFRPIEAAPAGARTPAPAQNRESSPTVPSAETLQELLKKIEKEGIDPGAVDQVQRELLSGADPQSQRMFQDMVGGLLGGKLSVADIRREAQNAASQLEELKGQLGAEAEILLDGYLSILQNFLNRSAPTPPARE